MDASENAEDTSEKYRSPAPIAFAVGADIKVAG
jgi:hypothetical protein